MLLTHTKRSRKTNLERSSPRSLLATRMRRDRIKTPDGCKGGWTCAKHAPQRGEDSMGRVRIKTPGGCKGGWTCAKHAPRRGEDSMGRVRIKTPDGRWTRRDYLPAQYEHNSYCFAKNVTTYMVYLQRRQHWLVEPP